MATELKNTFEMVVSEKGVVNGKNQYVPRGKVTVHYPTLSDFGYEAEVKEQTEEGFPVYVKESDNFLFSSLLAAVRANARNKIEIVNGVVQCKEGLSIADTLEALMEAGTAGGNGKALQDIRDFVNAVRAYMVSLGKSTAVVNGVVGFCDKPATIAIIEDVSKKAKIEAYLSDFVATITDDDATRWAKRITLISEMCNAGSVLDAEDF